MSNGPVRYNEGIPLQAIAELMKTHSHVGVRVMRMTQKGRPGLLYANIPLETEQLSSVDAIVGQLAGGGTFGFHVFDPQNAVVELIEPFQAVVEGPARTPQSLDGSSGPPPEWDSRVDARTIGVPAGVPASTGFPSWAQPGGTGAHGGMPPPMRQPGGYPGGFAGGMGAAARAGAREYPGGFGGGSGAEQVLGSQNTKYERALAELSANFQALQQQLVEERRRADKREADLEKQRAEERHRAELRALEQKIDMLSQRHAQPQQGQDWTALVPALVPLFIEMVRSNASGSTKMMELMIAARGNGGGDPFDQLAKLTPLLGKLVDSKGGGKDAEMVSNLLSQMSEANMNNAMLGAQLVKSFAEEKLPPEHPGFQLVKQLAESGLSVATAYFSKKEEEERNAARAKQLEATRAQALEAQTRANAAQAQQATVQAQAATANAAAATAQAAATAAAVVSGATATTPATPAASTPTPVLTVDPALFKMLPASFQTPQWQKILTELHTEVNGKPKVPANEISAYIAHFIEHLMIFNELPVELAGIQTAPRATVQSVFALLPINAKHPEYAASIVNAVASIFEAQLQPAPPNSAIPQSQPANGVQQPDEGDPGEIRYPS